MTPHPITIHPRATFLDAYQLMRQKRVRRLPVVEGDLRVVGIVTEMDMLNAAPAPRNAEVIYELSGALAEIPITDIMSSPVITVPEDCPVEQAAWMMQKNNISSLPVTRDGRLAGLITASDIFRLFSEALGEESPGWRITIRVREEKGQLARITGELARLGGNITNLFTYTDKDPRYKVLTMKIQEVQPGDIIPLFTDIMGVDILSVREIQSPEAAAGE
jgi:acetoin utilization protein AcuB